MEVQFFNQPFDETNRLGSLLEIELPSAERFWGLSAWAQISGLRHIAPLLRNLRKTKASTQLLVGIDGGIATRPSLELALELFDTVHIFHDPAGDRIYHPKIYCIEGKSSTVVSIGSSNLTSGGLFKNYEGNVVLRLSNDSKEDLRFVQRIRDYWNQFFIEGMPTRLLDLDLLNQLEESNTLIQSGKEEREDEVIERVRRISAGREIFGRRAVNLPVVPLSSNDPVKVKSRSVLGELKTVKKHATPTLWRADRIWWKKLTRSDAMRKDSGSHQRNYVILGRASLNVDQKTWFKDEFFRGVIWIPEVMKTGKIKEKALVPFEVFVDDTLLGTYNLRIDHADHRIAGQNNAPTWLNWEELLPLIRKQDFTDWFLVLEKRGHKYRLRLTQKDPSK